HKEIHLLVHDAADKAKVIRGLSQLKNLDTEWKNQGNNYYLRLKVEILSRMKNGKMKITVKLIDGIKYRNGRI
ncbi:MAG: hypothetical protein ACRCUS_05065, partial [Anaerovoracaceae bacterium]